VVKKIFLDTSLFIRFFTKDLTVQYEQCEAIFRAIQAGKFKPYISNIVLAEIVFVLTRTYRFSKPTVINAIASVLNIRNLTLIEITDSHKAITLFKQLSIKYQDCLIASQLPKGVALVSYDRDFAKIPSINLAKPEEIIGRIRGEVI
jgi:predicted nucleic-acid-binding protein